MIKFGVITRENQEHITTVASFAALLSFIETWLDNTTEPRSLGIILDELVWKFDDYLLPNMGQTTVSFQSFAIDGEEHFPANQMREIITRCKELILTPMHPEDDVIGFLMCEREIGFVVTTLKDASTRNDESNMHYPLSCQIGQKVIAND